MSIRIIRCHPSRFDQLAAFVVEHNDAPEHHIGFFGTTPADVRATLRMLNLRFDRGFRLAMDGGRLIGVCGFDIEEKMRRGWLYGPLVIADPWAATADALYAAAQLALPTRTPIHEQQMFIDARNANCRDFGARHGFDVRGEWSILYITPDRLALLPPATADDWEGRFATQLGALHERSFPNSVYSLATILADHEKGGLLLIVTEGDTLVGYLVGRAEPEAGEAYIDLIGVAETHRRGGLGRRLMLAGLDRLRRMPGLRQVNLSVAVENHAALALYDSLGFARERDMVSLRRCDSSPEV